MRKSNKTDKCIRCGETSSRYTTGMCNSCYSKKRFERLTPTECSQCKEIRKCPYIGPTCQSCYKRTINPNIRKRTKAKLRRDGLSDRQAFNNGKGAAKSRNKEWTLSFDEYTYFRSQSCFYCGGELPKSGVGLDRIDSKGGYTKENVVPCCTSCNIIKGQNLSLTETLSAVQAIKNSQQETLTRVMNDNVHIDTRTIFLFGDINEQVAVSFRQKFEFLVKINKFAPININIMSNGGDWYSALGMYDTITTSDTPVYCYGMGMVASAATIIFAAGDERVLYPHSTILIHDGTEYFEGKTVDAKQTLWEMARQSDVMYAIYEKNSNRDKEFWKGKCSSEFYVSAEEAVDLGIADRIELPKEKIR